MEDNNAVYEYAKDLSIYLWSTWYKHIAPNWEPLDDTFGVLTQIDNMIVGLESMCKKRPTSQEIKNYRKIHSLKIVE